MNKRGFTIVEVIVSLGLLLTLAAMANMAVDVAAAQRMKARDTTTGTEQVRAALYAGEQGSVTSTPGPQAEYTFKAYLDNSTFTLTPDTQIDSVTVGGETTTFDVFATPTPAPAGGGGG